MTSLSCSFDGWCFLKKKTSERDGYGDDSYLKHPFKESLHTPKLVKNRVWRMRLEDDHFLSKCLYNSDLPWLAVWTHQYCSHSTATVLFFNQALVIGPSIQAVKTIWGLNSFGLISSSTGKQSETISKVWKETKLARAWATSLVSIGMPKTVSQWLKSTLGKYALAIVALRR